MIVNDYWGAREIFSVVNIHQCHVGMLWNIHIGDCASLDILIARPCEDLSNASFGLRGIT